MAGRKITSSVEVLGAGFERWNSNQSQIPFPLLQSTDSFFPISTYSLKGAECTASRKNFIVFNSCPLSRFFSFLFLFGIGRLAWKLDTYLRDIGFKPQSGKKQKMSSVKKPKMSFCNKIIRF